MNLKSIKLDIQEWKTLDPKEVWTWPLIPKLGILVGLVAAIIAGGYFGLVSGKYSELSGSISKMESLKKTYKEKTEMALNLDVYKAQRDNMEKVFGELLKQLPNKAEMDGLLNDVNQAGIGRGMVFELFKPADKEKMFGFYAELPIAIKMSGTYHDFGEFSVAVANLARIVTINDMSLKIAKDTTLTMEATAKTFRYLDEKEVQEQKRKDAEAKSKSKAKGAKK